MRFACIAKRSSLACLITACAVRASIATPPDKATVQPSIALYVFNYAHVPGNILKTAEKETARIFSHSGISIDWVDVNLKANDPPRCAMDFAEQPCCMLRINPHLTTDEMSHEIAGYAYHGTPFASIIFNVIVEEANSVGLPQSLILGHTMAHEIAHLFLPQGYHSPEGIMQPRINEKAWRQADQGSLLFSSWETKWLQQNVLAHKPQVMVSPVNRPCSMGRPLN